MPTRTMLRIAVRRRSFGMRPGQPAARHGDFHSLPNATIGRGFLSPPRPSATIRNDSRGQSRPTCWSCRTCAEVEVADEFAAWWDGLAEAEQEAVTVHVGVLE